jgi:hypothetical protein
VNHPRILGIGTANPLVRLTQEQSFHAAGYPGERIRKIFLKSDIDHPHFYLEGTLNRGASSDQLHQRHLRSAMKTGYRAILNCLEAAGTTYPIVISKFGLHNPARNFDDIDNTIARPKGHH